MGKGPTTPSVPGGTELFGRTPLAQFPVNAPGTPSTEMQFGISKPGGGSFMSQPTARPFPSSKGVSSRPSDGFVRLDGPQPGGGFWDSFGSAYEANQQQRLLAAEEAKRQAAQQALVKQAEEEERERRRQERESDRR